MALSYKTTEWNSKKVILGEGPINPEIPIKILIGFHGAESTPENILVHGNHLQLENILMLFPEGPVDAGEGRWSWWTDGPKQKESVNNFLNFSSDMINMAEGHLNSGFEDIETRVCLWGFSQGGAASLVYTLLGIHPLYKTASVCGFLPETPERETTTEISIPILGIFGTNDDVVPSFLAEHALEEMRNKGHNPTILETPQGHELNSENLTELRKFFSS